MIPTPSGSTLFILYSLNSEHDIGWTVFFFLFFFKFGDSLTLYTRLSRLQVQMVSALRTKVLTQVHLCSLFDLCYLCSLIHLCYLHQQVICIFVIYINIIQLSMDP